jgi:hypothetical protein
MGACQAGSGADGWRRAAAVVPAGPFGVPVAGEGPWAYCAVSSRRAGSRDSGAGIGVFAGAGGFLTGVAGCGQEACRGARSGKVDQDAAEDYAPPEVDDAVSGVSPRPASQVASESAAGTAVLRRSPAGRRRRCPCTCAGGES